MKLGRLIHALGNRLPPVVYFTDGAAALTYYTVLSLFPGLALLMSALALVGGGGTTDSVIEVVRTITPPEFADVLIKPIENMGNDSGLSGTALLISAVVAVFTASRYVAAFGRAADRVHGVESMPAASWRRRPLSMLLVLATVVWLPMALLAMLISGPIAVAVGDALGMSRTARDFVGVLRWPLLGIAGAGVLTILYLSSERLRKVGVRHVLPGAIAAIAVWLVASALFSLYISNLTGFSLTYGSLAGVVAFLIWLYVFNLAALGGVAVNSLRLGTPAVANVSRRAEP